MRNPRILWILVLAITFSFVGSVRADAASDAVKGLEAWLAKPASERGKISERGFASVGLNKEQAEKARKLVWGDHVKMIRAEREKEWKDLAITIGEHTLKLKEKTFGTK